MTTQEHAGWRQITGPPPTLEADDRSGARAYLSRVRLAIETGGWTRSEWSRLYALRDKWQTRADGRDARFRVVGNERRGLTAEERVAVERIKQQQVGQSQTGGIDTHDRRQQGRVGERLDDAAQPDARNTRDTDTTTEAGTSGETDAAVGCRAVPRNTPTYGWGGRRYKSA